MAVSSEAADQLAQALVSRCIDAGVTVATAESCTAGLVAATIADIPGASSVLRGGAVTYVDEVKHEILGVSTETLDRFTAVSAPCAEEMAAGARARFTSTYAVSTTGYAGPGGGTEQDPVGTVYFGLSTPQGTTSSCMHFEGTREEVRLQACGHALELLLGAVSPR